MTKLEKTELLDSLSAEFKDASAMIVCDYKGLGVKSLESLRSISRKDGIKVQVIKNTLASIAMNKASYPDLGIKDTNIFIWGKDQISLSKIVCKFAEANEKLVVKVGCFEGQKVDASHIIAVSKLPSRDELIGMLLSVWSAPARYFVTGLDNLRKQKEQN